jgi:demethylmenaquinone methyltransferase/2-methoxy-6-polyprenyl-1,4-benzoquinol methylase
VTVWHEIEDALEAITDDYIKVNHIISLIQDEKARIKGLKKAGHLSGVALEVGSGPGNFTEMLAHYFDGGIVCLDYSEKMLHVALSRREHVDPAFIRGVFDALPIRTGAISFVTAAFALRDAQDKETALKEIRRTLEPGGRLLVVDVGKPNNRLFRGILFLYMRFIVPLLGGLATGRGYKNPWSLLVKTYELLPINRELEGMMREVFGRAAIEEIALSGLVVGVAKITNSEV